MYSKTRLLMMSAALSLAPAFAFSQEDSGSEISAMSAVVSVSVARTSLDDLGDVILDDSGNPVISFVPVETDNVIPGDQIRYLVAVKNETDNVITDVDVTFDIPFQTTLIPDSVVSSVQTEFYISETSNPEDSFSMFDVSGEDRLVSAAYQDLDAEDGMLMTARIAEVAAQSITEINYNLIVK